MGWQEQVFGAMRGRTLEEAQIRLLTRRGLSPQDPHALRTAVRKVNAELDADEGGRGIRRARAGELYLPTSRGSLLLPLRTDEALARVMAGERWAEVRRGIVLECESRYRALFPKTSQAALNRFLRMVWPGRAPRTPKNANGGGLVDPRRRRDPEDALDTEDGGSEAYVMRTAELRKRASRAKLSAHTVSKLLGLLEASTGVAPERAGADIEALIELRARFHPRTRGLRPGEMPLAVPARRDREGVDESGRGDTMVPVVIRVLANREAHILRYRPPRSHAGFLNFHGKRIARVLRDAYAQGGILSLSELQWVFLFSTATVARAADRYQRTRGVLLPSAATVLGSGCMLTHGDLIVQLSLQGRSPREIATKTHQPIRAVEACLREFESVAILTLHDVPPPVIAHVLGIGEHVVEGHLSLIDERVGGSSALRRHLGRRAVGSPRPFPAP